MYLDLRNFLQLPITCIQVWFTLSLIITLKNGNKSLKSGVKKFLGATQDFLN